MYDALGRQTVIPGADGPTGGGDVELSYFADDSVRTLTEGDVTTTFELDSLARRRTATTVGSGPTSTVTNQYFDTSDRPGRVTRTSGGETVETWYGESLTARSP